MMSFRRIAQASSLILFLFTLLWAAGFPERNEGLDFFLRLDPLTVVGVTLATREFIVGLAPGLVLLLAALMAGRFFCGYLCPMGATLDMLDWLAFRERNSERRNDAVEADTARRRWKYAFLWWILGAALLGVCLVHVGSPLSWVTRFYGLCVYPVAGLLFDRGLDAAGPLLIAVGLEDVVYTQVPQRVSAANVAFAAAFLGIAALGIIRKRYWCRFLCPAGALFALFSRKPVIRRQVSSDCTRCGRCVRECPTAAIMPEPNVTLHHECVVCVECVKKCPVNAISFGVGAAGRRSALNGIDVGRRSVLGAVTAGFFTGGLISSSLAQPRPLAKEAALLDESLIRPPGALPEPLFLRRCIRCGECMTACPTNTLQPTWCKAGTEGLFSPALVTRLAACAVHCATCGQVCPTGAIRPLPLVEKRHAKLGTAWVVRQNCLVWEQDRKCLVCDEACPYDAISFQPVPGLINPAPFVQENRCLGCGWCETRCPVAGAAAIRVNVMGELRLAHGSYSEKAREYGLEFKIRDHSSDRLAPGSFDGTEPPSEPGVQGESDTGGLPPGFTEIK